jgi:hypothetical protein
MKAGADKHVFQIEGGYFFLRISLGWFQQLHHVEPNVDKTGGKLGGSGFVLFEALYRQLPKGQKK